MFKKFSLAVATSLVLSSCASIVSKKEYPINITSDPVGAKFVIKDGDGVNVKVGTTPETVKLKAGEGYFKRANYSVKYKKDGYESEISNINAKIDGWYWGNIALGGLIGFLIVDPITGAMYKLPDTANMVLEPVEK